MADKSRSDALSRRLQACIFVEKSAAEIYRKLADLFPGESSFFMELCHEEEDHAAILSMGKLYKMVSHLPESIVPESMPMIADALSLGNEIKARIESGDLTLKEALELALRMERSVAEEHLQWVLGIENDSETIRKLRKLQGESTTHAERIKAKLQQKGLIS
jgi:rubrerythrin